jgi:hypothetical protein
MSLDASIVRGIFWTHPEIITLRINKENRK